MTTKVKQWGNSLAIRVPKEMAKRASLVEGSSVVLSLKNKNIVIVKSVNKKETLRDMVARITPENMHDFSFLNDDPIGAEIW